MREQQITTDVGKELLFENQRVKVWGMDLHPGESSHYHRHVNDYLFIYLTPSHIKLSPKGGAGKTTAYRGGYVQFNTVGTGIEHRITNVAGDRHYQIIVELKGGSAAARPQPPQHNRRFA